VYRVLVVVVRIGVAHVRNNFHVVIVAAEWGPDKSVCFARVIIGGVVRVTATIGSGFPAVQVVAIDGGV
jgi:hypothetical protein